MQDYTATNPQTGEKVVWNGQSWVPAGQAAQPAVSYIPPNPNSPKAQERAQDAANDARNQERDDARLALETRRVELAEAQAQEGGAGGMDKDKRAIINAAITQLNRVEQLYNEGYRDEPLGILSSIGEYLPGDDKDTFNSAATGLANIGRGAFRIPGEGTMSDYDAQQFAEANTPAATDRDARIEEKIRTMKQRLEAVLEAYGEPSPWATPEAPAGNERAIGFNAAPQVEAADGEKTVTDERLAGLNDLVAGMLARGEGNGPILKAIRDRYPTMQSALGDINRQISEFRKFQAENPNSPLPAIDLERRQEEMGAVEQVVSDLANTQLGAGIINSADAFALNTFDNIGGQDVANSLQLSQELNPEGATIGRIGGNLAGLLTGELALAKAGMKAGGLRSLLSDGTFGAGAGAGADEDGSRADGAINGAVAALGGNLAGQALTRGVGSVVSPAGRGSERLYEQGVRPTPGQRALAWGQDRGGVAEVAGRAVNAVEEGFGSIPFVGQSVRNARAQAVDEFQTGAFNQALGELEGLPGLQSKLPSSKMKATDRHKFTQQQFDRGYDAARANMRVVNDQALEADMQAVGQAVAGLSEQSQRRFFALYKQHVAPRARGGTMDGNEYKKVVSELGGIVRRIRKNQSGDGELADVIDDFIGALDGAARRHSAPEAVQAMDKLDRGYAKFVVIEDAARRVGGDAGEFTPAAFDRAVQNSGSRVRSKAYLQGEGMMQEYAEQGRNLIDRIPDSGTPERLALIGAATTAAGGAAYADPSTLGPIGAVALAYSPVGRKMMGASMAPRNSQKVQQIGDRIRNIAPIAGTVGASLTLPEQ